MLLGVGMEIDRDVMLRKLVDIQYSRNDSFLGRGRFELEATSSRCSRHMESAYRISLFGDEVEQITHFDPLTGEVYDRLQHLAIFPLRSTSPPATRSSAPSTRSGTSSRSR